MAKSLGAHIREQRKLRRLTIEKFAELVGITPVFVGQLERGVKMPSIATLIKIINVLEVSADYLLRGEVTTGKPYIVNAINEKMMRLPPKGLKVVENIVDCTVESLLQLDLDEDHT